MDQQLANALQPVLRDATASGVPCPVIVDDDWIEVSDTASATLSGTGISMPLDVPEAEQVAAVADQVQEWIIEELWGSAPTNWPPCPLHPVSHPLRAEAVGGTAEWTCPVDRLPIAPVGALTN